MNEQTSHPKQWKQEVSLITSIKYRGRGRVWVQCKTSLAKISVHKESEIRLFQTH